MAESITLDDVKASKRRELGELLMERAKWARIRREAEENEKICNASLIPLLQKLDISNIVAEDDEGVSKRFILSHGTSSRIDRTLLMNKNVDPRIIDECTKIVEYDSLQVRTVKEAE